LIKRERVASNRALDVTLLADAKFGDWRFRVAVTRPLCAAQKRSGTRVKGGHFRIDTPGCTPR